MEVLSPQTGQPLPGFTEADCRPFTGDAVRHQVRWRETAQLDRFEGKPVQLRFRLDRAKLFSFQFARASLELRFQPSEEERPVPATSPL